MSLPAAVRSGLSLALVPIAFTAGCGSSASPAAQQPTASSAPMSVSTPVLAGTVTVFAAASLTSTFSELATEFQTAHPGTTVRFSFGPSSGLAQQIIAGAPADVFASASPKNMKQVTDAGDATGAQPFAKNAAEVAVSTRSAAKVKALVDLAKAGIKVALCQPQVPCGALAQKVLANAKVRVTPVTQGLDVKSTLAYVTSDQVDAAIVYVTDVLAAKGKVVGVQIPVAVNASTAYEVATVKSSRNADLAAAFEQFVLSADGQKVLAAAGFQGP